MVQLGIGSMIMAVDIASQPRFLAVLVGVVVLLTVLEQAVLPLVIVLSDLGGIVLRPDSLLYGIAGL
jgi:hypothetical protein